MTVTVLVVVAVDVAWAVTVAATDDIDVAVTRVVETGVLYIQPC